MTRVYVTMMCVLTAVTGVTLWLHTIVTPADVMIQYSQDAIAYARQHHQVELDYSEESIEVLESLIDQTRARYPEEEKRNLYARMWGGYFGEIIRRQHGGVWKQPSGGQYFLETKGVVVPTVSKVRERLFDRGGTTTLPIYYEQLLNDWSR
jgi:hypothetical protein